MNTRNLTKILNGLALATIAAFGSCAIAQTQNYPLKPIRLVVPIAPGGGNDTLARYVA